MKESKGYGPKLNAPGISQLLEHSFQRNLQLLEEGQLGTPICIWGSHGLGKTEMVQEYAKSKDWNLAYCAPAQFEEMGDLHGMPTIKEDEQRGEVTIFAPPEWVPTEEGPGILLLDDINRADDRILRGIMQLLQNFAMFSWELPPKWQIVATANPEGSGYSVTPMDEAMLTRMIHLTMSFDAKAWGKWAMENGVDPRGIDFVLSYPESVTGNRTTPRTLAQFFAQIKGIKDLRGELDLVSNLAASILDESTVAAFVNFVNNDLGELLTPEDILDAPSETQWKDRLHSLAKGKDGSFRIDRVSTICTRVLLYITADTYEPSPRHVPNFSRFMQDQCIPNDLRMSVMMELSSHPSPESDTFLQDKDLAVLLVDKL